MKSVLGVLRNDIHRMERELAQKQMRIDKLKEMVSHYEDLSRGQNRQAVLTLNGVKKASAVKTEIINLLKDGPKHRREILDALAQKQLLSDTEQDMNYLASRLSMWKDTTTDGKGNWYLQRYVAEPASR